MRFDEKARENLESATRLLPDESGGFEGLANSAASRAYYAAYLAVADRAQQNRIQMTARDAAWYRHDTLPDDARAWGLLDEGGAEDLMWLRDLRIKADYYEDWVSLEEASEALDVAMKLVGTLLNEEVS